MKITGIRVYQVDLPLHEGRYQWSGGKSVDVFDTTVVEVLTDAGGLTGIGEVCPLGPVYLPAFAGGARAGIAEIAPHLIGLDPRQPAVVYQAMERALKGHPYAKSALDMACWDLLGKASDQPLCNLLGGRFGESHVLYRAISQEEPETMARKVAAYREEGYRRFQLKVGGEPDEDIQRIRAVSALMRPGDILVADANTGWLMKDAMRVVRAVRDLDVFIEQPCATYEECLSVRRRTDHPFVLDESIDDLPELVRAINDQAMDVINIKISKLGGISRAREVRDVCLRSGIAMTIEDTWGGDVVTAAISHLAHSTPTAFLFTSTDFNSYVTVDIADGAPRRRRGRLAAPTAPGLGVTLKHDVLGDPVAVHGQDARS